LRRGIRLQVSRLWWGLLVRLSCYFRTPLVLGRLVFDIHSFGGSGAFGVAFCGRFEAFEALGAMIELCRIFQSERLD
jgi:hypothetical protein